MNPQGTPLVWLLFLQPYPVRPQSSESFEPDASSLHSGHEWIMETPSVTKLVRNLHDAKTETFLHQAAAVKVTLNSVFSDF